ncbi:transposase, partial [Micromonospora sp. NPDC050276]|uniref:transposase n=1 Tax=Micromonospora sp. NPDC050276 TaxID=3364278 RepID=UPI0037911AFE
MRAGEGHGHHRRYLGASAGVSRGGRTAQADEVWVSGVLVEVLPLPGIGPSGAARLLVEVGDITRFPNRAHFASWNGT